MLDHVVQHPLRRHAIIWKEMWAPERLQRHSPKRGEHVFTHEIEPPKMLLKRYSPYSAEMPLSIPIGKGKLLLHFLRPGLLIQHLSKQPIELDERRVVQQSPDTITGRVRRPIK